MGEICWGESEAWEMLPQGFPGGKLQEDPPPSATHNSRVSSLLWTLPIPVSEPPCLRANLIRLKKTC